MSTQYNTKATPYQEFYPPGGHPSTYAFALLEEHQLHTLLTSPEIDIRGKTVLDIACGTGFYTTRWLTWGAASVVGLDISPGMVDAARADAQAQGLTEAQIRFEVGDATDETLIIEAPAPAPPPSTSSSSHPTSPPQKFDIVTGIWLLNYADSHATMTRMFSLISRHLKPGGHFVGLTIPPLFSTSPAESSHLDFCLSPQGPHGRYGNRGHVSSQVPDGLKVWMELGLPETGRPTVGFETFYLRNEVFEAACRDQGGFEGLVWRDWVVGEELKRNREVGFWNEAVLSPHGRCCTARRKG